MKSDCVTAEVKMVQIKRILDDLRTASSESPDLDKIKKRLAEIEEEIMRDLLIAEAVLVRIADEKQRLATAKLQERKNILIIFLESKTSKLSMNVSSFVRSSRHLLRRTSTSRSL